jgi:hypothetical protein
LGAVASTVAVMHVSVELVGMLPDGTHLGGASHLISRYPVSAPWLEPGNSGRVAILKFIAENVTDVKIENLANMWMLRAASMIATQPGTWRRQEEVKTSIH